MNGSVAGFVHKISAAFPHTVRSVQREAKQPGNTPSLELTELSTGDRP